MKSIILYCGKFLKMSYIFLLSGHSGFMATSLRRTLVRNTNVDLFSRYKLSMHPVFIGRAGNAKSPFYGRIPNCRISKWPVKTPATVQPWSVFSPTEIRGDDSHSCGRCPHRPQPQNETDNLKYNPFYCLRSVACFVLLLASLASCKSKAVKPEEEAQVITPVNVTSIEYQPMEESIDLNATSTFLQKWIVRSNATGYLQSANVNLNKYVSNGQVLYTVKTKEAQSIGNSIKILDSTFHFSGINTIKAIGSGFISQVDHQNGDYVQDGEQLAVITDTRSFVFILQLPYELRPYIRNKKTLQMTLPDGEKLLATISGEMPVMDSSAQTQRIILKVKASHTIPENLIAQVKVVKSGRGNANSLPRAAVLSNETQDEFWVMKMIDAGTAVKVPVKKGIETDNLVEIISPAFSANDKILVTGNYGLGDTAKVKVMAASAKKE